MAAADESLLELDDEKIITGFIKLQGHIRGMLMRKAFRDIQKDYEEIVADIEEDMTVHWPSNAPGLPVFRRKRDKKQIVSQTGDKSRCETDHLQAPPHSELPSDVLSSRTENCPSNFSAHTVNCQASNLKNENGKSTRKLNENIASEEKPRCDISSLSSHKATQITIETQAIVTDKQDMLCDPLRDERTFNSCVSREVQTDLTKEAVDHQSDSIGKDNEKFTTETSAIQHLQKQTKVKSKSEILRTSLEEARTKEKDSSENENHYFSEMNQDQTSTSSSPFNPLNTKVKDGVLNQIVSTKDWEDNIQEMIGLDGCDAEHFHIAVKDSVSVVAKTGVTEERDRTAHPNTGVETNQDEPELNLPADKDQLVKLKSTLAMELLWIEQAINSRKNYLRIKQQLA